MNLYNSKTNSVETFTPIHKGKVSMYVCGPTVYNHPHIGNARPIVVFDLLRRILIELGNEVHYVSNYTDVDDRIIQKAKDEGLDETQIAGRYIAAYEDVRRGLFADAVDAKPKVTENMDEIIAFIEELIELEFAYESNGDVYFRVNKVKDYGAISSQNIDALKIGARIEENMQKESSLDFVLWKDTNDEGIKWDSPWGQGRPGWHTECVVMIQDEFNTNLIDIHGGGQDLKFPHHENESAQAKAVHHHDIANYWVHNAMLNIDGEKMSKSLGNVTWAKDYIQQFGGNVTRYLLLSTHYRLILNISDDVLAQAQKEVQKFEGIFKQVSLKLSSQGDTLGQEHDEDLFNDFMDQLKDDMNVANALVHVNETVKKINQALRSQYDFEAISRPMNTLVKMMNVLGLDFKLTQFTDEEKTLLSDWDIAKAEKRFEDADKLRVALIEAGVL
ncbi:MAG TPA: cysteine--tRNA ligase [Erysipelothrix sp.]|nr:cysteine--tRNA ligase [Erysipelothrix sp.]